MQRSRLILTTLIGSLIFLAGCEVGPKYVKANAPTTAQYKETPPESFKDSEQWKSAKPSDQALKGKWWEVFEDQQLSSLEEQLTVSNQDLKVAEARLREARAVVRANRAAQFPTITVGPSISGVRDSRNRPYFSATSTTG